MDANKKNMIPNSIDQTVWMVSGVNAPNFIADVVFFAPVLMARFNNSLFKSRTQLLYGFTAKEALDATHVTCSVLVLHLCVKQKRKKMANDSKLDDTMLLDCEITLSGSGTNATSTIMEALRLSVGSASPEKGQM